MPSQRPESPEVAATHPRNHRVTATTHLSCIRHSDLVASVWQSRTYDKVDIEAQALCLLHTCFILSLPMMHVCQLVHKVYRLQTDRQSDRETLDVTTDGFYGS